jgi:OOP family OmpA-OmpF porin
MKSNNLMTLIKASAVAAGLFVSGCAEYYLEKLEESQPDGYPFARALKTEYETLARKEARVYNDQIDASAFAVKGLQASHGLEVLPEDPRLWDVPEARLPMLMDSRERLLFDLHKNGRVLAPELAARTQVAYDCWIEEEEERFQGKEGNRCERVFNENIVALEDVIEKNAPWFRVYFDFNSHNLRKDAWPAIERIAKIAKSNDNATIKITAHADASGGRKFNLWLTQQRAMAVRDALIKMGIDPRRIKAIGAGELGTKQLEPKHRRADIEVS